MPASAGDPRAVPARRRGRRGLAQSVPPPAQLVTAAGTTVVTAARVGRLLGRSYWRIARQLPGVGVVEREAQRLRETAAGELLRMLDVQQVMPQLLRGTTFLGAGEDTRLTSLLHNAADDPAPLRSAMSELLQRAETVDGPDDRSYLFGNIVSQLVPDEARMVAALAGGRAFAAVDVTVKHVGRPEVTVLRNVSTVALIAGIARPEDGVTYLGRLEGLGLVAFDGEDAELGSEYDALLSDAAVQRARTRGDGTRLGSTRVVRRTVRLSELGQQFWDACAPAPLR